MNAEFYLFNVDHGQSAALRLPNGRWCIFDVGCSSVFSPVQWIARHEASRRTPQRSGLAPMLPSMRPAGVSIIPRPSIPFPQSMRTGRLNAPMLSTPAPKSVPMYSPLAPLPPTHAPSQPAFMFLKGTISHLHCDHLDDYRHMFKYGPNFLRTVSHDAEYLCDCRDTCGDGSWEKVAGFLNHFSGTYTGTATPDYGGVRISEMWLPVSVARQLGGQANSRVNNASIITRIDVCNNSILLCGDMEKDAWDEIIGDQRHYGPRWRPFLSKIDILVAPHHGHSSAYSGELMKLATPKAVLISAVTKDPHVDSRYSQDPIRGIKFRSGMCKSLTTRAKGHIKISISSQDGSRNWAFGDQAIT